MTSGHYRGLFFLAVAALTIYRTAALYFVDAHVNTDEAQYWVWAQNLDWGYYSKPPMVAWLIGAAVNLFGNSSFVIKMIPIAIYPLSATFVYLAAQKLVDAKIAFYAGTIFLTMPAVAFSSHIISTDVPLFLWWAGAFYFLLCAAENHRFRDWTLTGIFVGLGLLSKYNMVIFFPSAWLYRIYLKRWHNIQPSPFFYWMVAVAFLVFAPNLIWNYHNDFVAFSHLWEISQIERTLFHPQNLLRFIAEQFFVFGILSFAALIVGFFLALKNPSSKIMVATAIFAAVFLLIIFAQALAARAFANWAAPAYVSASILAAYILVAKNYRWWLNFALALNIAFMGFLYHYDFIFKTLKIEQSRANDPFKKNRGWEKLGAAVDDLRMQFPQRMLLAENRETIAKIIYHTSPNAFDTKIYNPEKRAKNYFAYRQNLNDERGRDFLLLSADKNIENIAQNFARSRFIKTIEIPIHADYALRYHIFALDDFRGY